MSEDLFDSPPIEHAEEELHDETELAPVELGEAVAAARRPASAAIQRRPIPIARPRRAALAFLHLENLPSDKGSGHAPLVAWIVVQVAAIAAAGARWKFWATAGAGAAPSVELLALDTLLIVQLAVGTLIYPILLDTWSKLALTVSTVIAFDAIAWVMTDIAPPAALWACGFAVAWMIGLAAWRAAAPGAFATMLIRLVLAMLVLGWPIVVYLHGEFAVESNGTFAGAGGGGPLFTVAAQLGSPRLESPTWITAAAFLGSAVGGWLAKWLTRRRRSRPGEST